MLFYKIVGHTLLCVGVCICRCAGDYGKDESFKLIQTSRLLYILWGFFPQLLLPMVGYTNISDDTN